MVESKRLSEGDFLRLFVKHEQTVRAYARVLLPSWEAVDEVLQEASVVMWKKLDQLTDAEGFLPWAKVIVRFEALRLRRDHARDRHVFSDVIIELLASESAEVPDEKWEREREALLECVEKLAPHHRELLMAPYVGDGYVTRLAEDSGRTANSLYKLLGRLREKLMECVENKLTRLILP